MAKLWDSESVPLPGGLRWASPHLACLQPLAQFPSRFSGCEEPLLGW